MKLSAHITMAEATRTKVRKANTPGESELVAMALIANKVFEPLRILIGEPIHINSFFRSPEVNKAVGGSATSQHVTGQAMDISIRGKNKLLFDTIINNFTYDQLIWEHGTDEEPDWIHVSYKRRDNRRQVLRAKKVNGKTQYIKL